MCSFVRRFSLFRYAFPSHALPYPPESGLLRSLQQHMPNYPDFFVSRFQQGEAPTFRGYLVKVRCSQALAKDSAGDLPLSGYCGGACTTAPRGGPGSWLPKGEQLGIVGAKAIDLYAFSWGVPRTPASNLIDTAPRKSQL